VDNLETRIAEKISAVKSIENELPGVLTIHDIRDTTLVYMSERGLKELNTTIEELRSLGPEYHSRFFNDDDAKEYVPKILGLIERDNDLESISFFQQVRASEHHDWVWHSSCTKIFMRDDDNRPLLTITSSIPVDPKHHFTIKLERLLEENNFLRKNQPVFSSLSKREREVLKYMALGQNSAEIAATLFISEATATTHRRNIKSKLNAKNNYDITLFAQAFNLI